MLHERDNRLNTMDQIMAAHRGHWFDKDTMRFFRSRVSYNVYPTGITERGTLFVSSERSSRGPRLYTVHRALLVTNPALILPECIISTVGEFQEYPTAYRAHSAARRMREAEQREHRPEWFPEKGEYQE